MYKNCKLGNHWLESSYFISRIKQLTWMASVSIIEEMPRNFAISAKSAIKCIVIFYCNDNDLITNVNEPFLSYYKNLREKNGKNRDATETRRKNSYSI